MKFGVGVPALILYPPVISRWEPEAPASDITRVVQKADELSYDWATVPEHIIMPDEMAEVMGTRFPEGWTAAVLAGATKRLRLLTHAGAALSQPHHAGEADRDARTACRAAG